MSPMYPTLYYVGLAFGSIVRSSVCVRSQPPCLGTFSSPLHALADRFPKPNNTLFIFPFIQPRGIRFGHKQLQFLGLGPWAGPSP
jgi:hypothetical protein